MGGSTSQRRISDPAIECSPLVEAARQRSSSKKKSNYNSSNEKLLQPPLQLYGGNQVITVTPFMKMMPIVASNHSSKDQRRNSIKPYVKRQKTPTPYIDQETERQIIDFYKNRHLEQYERRNHQNVAKVNASKIKQVQNAGAKHNYRKEGNYGIQASTSMNALHVPLSSNLSKTPTRVA